MMAENVLVTQTPWESRYPESGDSENALHSVSRHSTTSLDLYFEEISAFTKLTKEEEIALAHQAQGGDEAAFARLIECNLQFVVKVAREYRNLGLPLADLIHEGNLGLITAARRFDPSRGVKLISFAVWWIRNAILKALSDHSRIVRLPASQIKKMRLVRATEKALKRQLGRVPTDEEISAELPSKFARLNPIHRHGIRLTSIDEPVGGDGDEPFGEFLEDRSRPSVEQEIVRHDAAEKILELCAGLEERQRTVLNLRFGLDGDRPLTLREIGQHLGISREGVRLIEVDALEQLRRWLIGGGTRIAA